MQNGLQRALADLRASFAGSLVDDEPTQVLLFEAWVKREQWRLRDEALPLLVGTDPAVWQASPQSLLVREAGDRLAVALAARLQLEPDTDAHVTPLAFRAAAEALMLDLPPALARLLDFLARVLAFQQADTASASAQGLADAEDRLTVLGAALALVVRHPERCLDEEGYYSAERMVEEIFRQAVYWFPLGPPACGVAEAVSLLARWLPRAPERT